MNKILIFHEKHGNRYFDASTDAQIWAAAFKILKERYDYGWYNWMNEEKCPSKEGILFEKDIEKLPDPYKSQAQKALKDYDKEMKNWKENITVYSLIESTIEKNLHRQAWRLIQEMRNGEYENFTIKELENA